MTLRHYMIVNMSLRVILTYEFFFSLTLVSECDTSDCAPQSRLSPSFIKNVCLCVTSLPKEERQLVPLLHTSLGLMKSHTSGTLRLPVALVTGPQICSLLVDHTSVTRRGQR